MRFKLIGVGKCGSRICYDFFAHVNGLPSSYEIRATGGAGWLQKALRQVQDASGVKQAVWKARIQMHEVFGRDVLIDGKASYAVLDSDRDHNEVFRELEFESGKTALFPGTFLSLGDHNSGCDFHVVSEAIASHHYGRGESPGYRIAPDHDVAAHAFSVGGGTGGGAAPILSLCVPRPDTRAARLGIGILPETDEDFGFGAGVETDETEQYNSGRFHLSMASRRLSRQNTDCFHGVWLLANDLRRILAYNGKVESQSSPLSDPTLAKVNQYLASAFCAFLNSTSNSTPTDSDFDPTEVRNRFAGAHFVSGFAYAPAAASKPSEREQENNVMLLLTHALRNPHYQEDMAHGLSVPVGPDKLGVVLDALAQGMAQGYNNTFSELTRLGKPDYPTMFWTTERIVVLFGQPNEAYSMRLREVLGGMVRAVFRNTDECKIYHYKHAGKNDTLLLFLINPIIPGMLNNIYYYLGQEWDATGGSVVDEIENIITAGTQGDVHMLAGKLRNLESLASERVKAPNVTQLLARYPDRPSFDRAAVLSGLERIRAGYQRQRRPTGRTTLR